MYIAKHYVKDERGLFGPGEIIPEDLEEDKLERLLKLGAIRKAEPPKVIRQTAPELAPADELEPTEGDIPEIEIDAMAGIVQDEEAKKPAKTRRKK